MSASFEPGSMVSKSFELFKANVAPLLGGFLLLAVIGMVAGSFSMGIGNLIVMGPLCYGFFKICQEIVRGKSPEITELFSGFQVFLPTFLTFLLVSIFSGIGFMLCIVPGIFVSIIYGPVYFFLLEGEQNFWEAMEKSRTMVMANLGQWAILTLVVIVLNIVGMLACGVGVLVTGPMSGLMLAMAFDAERGGAPAQAQVTE